MTFAINDMTKIMPGKGMMKMEDLKEGLKVFVEYKKEDDNLFAWTRLRGIGWSCDCRCYGVSLCPRLHVAKELIESNISDATDG